MQQSLEDYKKIFTELIQKQLVVLGPDITLARVKNVIGLTVTPSGEVVKIDGDPQLILQNLINQFVELSGLIVKKTMESILSNYSSIPAIAPQVAQMNGIANGSPIVQAPVAPVQNATQPTTPPPAADSNSADLKEINNMIQQMKG